MKRIVATGSIVAGVLSITLLTGCADTPEDGCADETQMSFTLDEAVGKVGGSSGGRSSGGSRSGSKPSMSKPNKPSGGSTGGGSTGGSHSKPHKIDTDIEDCD